MPRVREHNNYCVDCGGRVAPELQKPSIRDISDGSAKQRERDAGNKRKWPRQKLVYDANRSNPQAPDARQVMVYQCTNCPGTTSRSPKMYAISRGRSRRSRVQHQG